MVVDNVTQQGNIEGADVGVYFAYDKKVDTYYYCSADGAVTESGYRSICTNNE